jgi:hypothetical protein
MRKFAGKLGTPSVGSLRHRTARIESFPAGTEMDYERDTAYLKSLLAAPRSRGSNAGRSVIERARSILDRLKMAQLAEHAEGDGSARAALSPAS